MDKLQLRKHLDKFDTRRSKYFLEVDYEDGTCSGIHPANRQFAFLLCETAKKSRVTKYIHLYYFPNPDTEIVLYDSENTEEMPCTNLAETPLI